MSPHPDLLLRTGVFLSFCLLCSGLRDLSAEVVVAPDTLGKLPRGSVVHDNVRSVDGRDGPALSLRGGAISLPSGSVLSAARGRIDIVFQLPNVWPSQVDATLFHAGEAAHIHATLFFRGGGLIAVYKGGEQHYANVRHPETAKWRPGSWHSVVFGWEARGREVSFSLRVDGELSGVSWGRLIPRWPSRIHLGTRNGRSPWKGLVESATLSMDSAVVPEFQPGQRTVLVDCTQELGPCHEFWSIGNSTSQDQFDQPGYGKKLRRARPFVTTINCVRLLGGRHDGKNTFYRGQNADGGADCDFSGMIAHLQGIITAGCTPSIVLDNVPAAMAVAGPFQKYGSTLPPKAPEVWHSYVTQAVQAMVGAFSKARVAGWRFRVGTEPDLYPGHWSGTKEQYLAHFDNTVDAVTRILPDADIGPGNILNPVRESVPAAERPPQWGLGIIDHAGRGTNAVTGETGTRLTFFQFSWYGRVGRSVESLADAVATIRARLGAYPALASLPIDIAESGILTDEHDRRLYSGDISEWGASWYAAVADDIYRLGIRNVHEWAQTTAGLHHPRIHVIEMLGRMVGGQRVSVSLEGASYANSGAIACRKGTAVYILVYNHRPYRKPSVPENITLVVKDSRFAHDQRWIRSEWWVDRRHGVFGHEFYRDCAAAGLKAKPNSPFFGGNPALRFGDGVHQVLWKNHEKYEELSRLPRVLSNLAVPITDGTATLAFDMPGHSVRLIQIRPLR